MKRSLTTNEVQDMLRVDQEINLSFAFILDQMVLSEFPEEAWKDLREKIIAQASLLKYTAKYDCEETDNIV